MSEQLVKNKYLALEPESNPEIPTATLQVYEFIDNYYGSKESRDVTRASAAIHCYLRRWYQKEGIGGLRLAPRKQVNFLLGDLSEKAMTFFVAKGCVGEGRLYSEVDFGEKSGSMFYQNQEIALYKQAQSFVKIGDLTVTAHADGWGKRNSDGCWELIEFKSASNWTFRDFRKVGAKDYLKQALVNMQTEKGKELGVREVRFFFLRKETGHLWDRLETFDTELWEEVKAEYKLASAKKEPRRPYMLKKLANGTRTAVFPCTYCPYLQRCHGNYRVEFMVGQNGKTPRYIF